MVVPLHYVTIMVVPFHYVTNIVSIAGIDLRFMNWNVPSGTGTQVKLNYPCIPLDLFQLFFTLEHPFIHY